MPREPQKLVRPGGHLHPQKFIVIASEDSKTSPKYFSALRDSDKFNESGIIEIIQLPPRTHGGNSPRDIKKQILDEESDTNFRAGDEFWVVSDRDQWETIHHIDFDRFADECAKEKNMYWALSNPCFELWLLLHCTDLSIFTKTELSEIYRNKRITNHKNTIEKVLDRFMPKGRGYSKTGSKKLFIPNVEKAILRARSMSVPGELYPHKLGSDVYKLVEELIK